MRGKLLLNKDEDEREVEVSNLEGGESKLKQTPTLDVTNHYGMTKCGEHVLKVQGGGVHFVIVMSLSRNHNTINQRDHPKD